MDLGAGKSPELLRPKMWSYIPMPASELLALACLPARANAAGGSASAPPPAPPAPRRRRPPVVLACTLPYRTGAPQEVSMAVQAVAVAGRPDPRVAMTIVENMASSSDDADGLDTRPRARCVSSASVLEGTMSVLLVLRLENNTSAQRIASAGWV